MINTLHTWQAHFTATHTQLDDIETHVAVHWPEAVLTQDADLMPGETPNPDQQVVCCLYLQHEEDPKQSLEQLLNLPVSTTLQVAKDWVTISQQGTKPVTAGRFRIFTTAYADTPFPPNSWRLQIEASTAFGTGTHDTTRGCLLMLNHLLKKGFRAKRVLDMGCGSGILGLAAAKAFKAKTLGVDNDPLAIQGSRYHAWLNQLHPLFKAKQGKGYQGLQGRYDLIFANILAKPLCAMAPDLARHLKPKGYGILAGLLATQSQNVEGYHRAYGLKVVRKLTINEWQILLIQKP